MNATENDAEALKDVQIVADHIAVGKPVPPDVAARVQERANKIKQEIFAKHGVQDIGVSIIRELRGDLPEQ